LDNQRDAAIAVIDAASALAGLLLVFVGFVYARGEGLSNVNRGAKFKNAARAGVLLFVAMLVCCWFSLNYIQDGSQADYQIAMFAFRVGLVVTGLYALLVFFVHL
jgi:hypothetical protein